MVRNDYQVTLETVAPRTLAAVRRRVPRGGVGAAWGPALGLVWEFLRAHPGLRSDGHNVFLYRQLAGADGAAGADGDGAIDAAFGVEVVRDFEPAGDVASTRTPAGEAAKVVHVGSYDGIPRAHAALAAWRERSGRRFTGISWEIYGDWSDDPAKLETAIFYLLAA